MTRMVLVRKAPRSTLAVYFIMMTGILAVANTAHADPIEPGLDLFATVPETFVDLEPVIPGAGVVPLEGVPFGTSLGPNLFDTDTIVERKTGLDPFNVGDTGTVDIELVALQLRSVSPVDIGDAEFDVQIVSGVVVGGPANSPGQMTIFHDVPNGGTFESQLPVNARLTFTEVGNPSNAFEVPFNDTFVGNGVWSHTPGPGAIQDPAFPSGAFHPGVDPETGQKVLTIEAALLAQHSVQPAMVPEPSSLSLFGLGALGLLAYGRRKRKPTGQQAA